MTRRIPIAAERLPAVGARAWLRLENHCVVLFHTADGYRAIADSCPHQGASLASGKLVDGAVTCPAHGLRFDLASGAMRGAPGFSVATYPIDIDNGTVTITLPDQDSQHDQHC